ncbi:DUF2239 family protein [Deinococcus pimensis]|uniref:DUF2239 family protein n=1 Tax=Deinococcus pimensis TaxID=309888 RepID=UPI000488E49C|nr:DUF2239 family protein [Deinococcus pimensis]
MPETTYTAFTHDGHLVTAPLPDLLRALKQHHDTHGTPTVIFDDYSGRHVDFDVSGTLEDVLARHEAAPDTPTRATATTREVTLLPRHWAWLDAQPSGASAALRRLVDEDRRRRPDALNVTRAIEAARHVMTALAGNEAHFEDALRALYARDGQHFTTLVASWPPHLSDYVLRLARPALAPTPKERP